MSKLVERIKRARDSKKIPHFDHLAKSNFGLDAMFCKLCRAVLVTLVPDDRFRDKQGFDRMRHAQTPMYQEVEIMFDDGSRHITALCKTCARSLTKDKLEGLYMADLEELRRLPGPKEYMNGNVSKRLPVDFLLIEG